MCGTDVLELCAQEAAPLSYVQGCVQRREVCCLRRAYFKEGVQSEVRNGVGCAPQPLLADGGDGAGIGSGEGWSKGIVPMPASTNMCNCSERAQQSGIVAAPEASKAVGWLRPASTSSVMKVRSQSRSNSLPRG